MKPFPKLVALAFVVVAGVALQAQNQTFQSGSTGADLAFAPTRDINIVLPPDGRLNYTTVHVPPNVTVTFTPNAANTPVYLLATGGVFIEGNIRVDGEGGTSLRGGRGGPGGFAGGMPGILGAAPGNGQGPGGGQGHLDANQAGRGVYGSRSTAVRALDGEVYGSQLLVPLVGGSGGGGFANQGGGGGGGAILIASSTAITNVAGSVIRAWGGNPNGSGGAIRLVAPLIVGTGTLDVSGAVTAYSGRVRCDLIERQLFGLSFTPGTAPVTAGEAFMVTFPPNVPSLRLVSVAGEPVPANSPAGFTVQLPFGAPAIQPIVLEATDFGVDVPVAIRLTPAIGSATPPILTNINNVAAGSAQITVNATFPPNVPVFVEAWTR